MEERCKALEMSGPTFFKDPADCVYIKPLLEGFGEDKSLFDLEAKDKEL